MTRSVAAVETTRGHVVPLPSTHVWTILAFVWCGVTMVLPLRSSAAADRVDFFFDVKPILSDHCYACHGPDDHGRQGGLRLDTREGLSTITDSGVRPVVPGQPSASEMIRRIFSDNADELMPPPHFKNPLSPEQKQILQQWIAGGADFPEHPHWAFNPLGEVPVPTIGETSLSRGDSSSHSNPIDHFVQARLQKLGHSPAAPASRETLIRRLALDLTGLPPTIEELDRFQAAEPALWFAQALEHYLSLPAYGERMANDWVDLARFADTYGYQSDVTRDMSPWRDWVIRAFNDNLPYNDFITWQLAGDLLPEPTRDQYLATAFNRLHRQTNEGGSTEEEFRVEYVADRVHTFGTAFLGLTLECCRCHDHKYDPIKQRDYYRLAAFFNSIDESGLYSHFTNATPTPTLLLYAGDQEAQHQQLKTDLANAEQSYRDALVAAAVAFNSWQTAEPRSVASPTSVAHLPLDVINNNQSPASPESQPPATLSDTTELRPGVKGQAFLFNGDNPVTWPGIPEFRRTSAFSFNLYVQPTEVHPRNVVFHRSQSWTDSGSRGYELLLENGRPSFALIHFYPGNALRVTAREPLPLNEWSQLTITYDGSSRAAGVRLYRNGQPLAVDIVRDNLYRDILHLAEWGDGVVGSVQLALAGRFRDMGLKNGLIDEFSVYDRALSAAEVKQLAGCPIEPADLLDHYQQTVDPGVAAARAARTAAAVAENQLATQIREIMVMRELPQPRETHVLKRGAYDAPGEVVTAGVPEGIAAWPSELPLNRLGLARWLTDPRHPLTARVVVNRIWRMHFGRGLVPTQEDFGNQGQLPSHPDLLDWLSRWFIDNNWNVKQLHRLICTSQAWQQSSSASPELLAADPENRWLARGPRHRLLAEQIRDSALAVSGLLSPQVGGPSVKPYQPAGLWEESGTNQVYVQDHGESLYRRSLYTFWRRTAPPPTMLTFDATSREVCTAKRETTSTPLQALILLNDPQYVEAARVFADRLLQAHPGQPDQQLSVAFRRITSRFPSPAELKVLKDVLADQQQRFAQEPSAAEQYLAIGESPRSPNVAAVDLASLAAVVNLMMNHDEFVTKR